MKINGMNGTDTQAGTIGMAQADDPVGKNIKNQIAFAQKKLQELSSNKEMSAEDKMKKRQEIQQEITSLNQQLRQHQVEQRKAKQSKDLAMDDMLGGVQRVVKPGQKKNGMSQANMQALISADASIQQAEIQGSVATQMEGKARVLKSEIKMDSGRGAGTGRKQEALADLEAKAQAVSSDQIAALAKAGRDITESAEAGDERKKEDTSDGLRGVAETEETKKDRDAETSVPYPAVDVLL